MRLGFVDSASLAIPEQANVGLGGESSAYNSKQEFVYTGLLGIAVRRNLIESPFVREGF